LDRVLAYLDLRKTILTGELFQFTCFAGTMVQEMYATNPSIRAACERSICGHAGTLVADIEAAMRKYPVAEAVTAESLALHTQCVIQGAFILAKATGSAAVAADSIDHLRRYFLLLFRPQKNRRPVSDSDARRRRSQRSISEGAPT
jgi:TetR/AcrR family transcriptional repressor of nem operon